MFLGELIIEVAGHDSSSYLHIWVSASKSQFGNLIQKSKKSKSISLKVKLLSTIPFIENLNLDLYAKFMLDESSDYPNIYCKNNDPLYVEHSSYENWFNGFVPQ